MARALFWRLDHPNLFSKTEKEIWSKVETNKVEVFSENCLRITKTD